MVVFIHYIPNRSARICVNGSFKMHKNKHCYNLYSIHAMTSLSPKNVHMQLNWKAQLRFCRDHNQWKDHIVLNFLFLNKLSATSINRNSLKDVAGVDGSTNIRILTPQTRV